MGLPCLTLVALQHIDFTGSMLEVYFRALLCLLAVSNGDDITIRFDIILLFPFGLKLTAAQREDMIRYNIRFSDFIHTYEFPEFGDLDPYA